MNRRDFLRASLGTAAVAAVGVPALAAGSNPLAKGPFDKWLIENAQKLIASMRQKVGISGLVQVSCLNLGFKEASYVTDAAIVTNSDIFFRKRHGKLTRMVSVEGWKLVTGRLPRNTDKNQMTGTVGLGVGANFVPVGREDFLLFTDGKKQHLVHTADAQAIEYETGRHVHNPA